MLILIKQGIDTKTKKRFISETLFVTSMSISVFRKTLLTF